MSDIQWGSVADWASAFGSVSASIVALYLARASSRVKLDAYVGIRTIYSNGVAGPDVVSLTVTNIGTRTTRITTTVIRSGPWWKKRQYGIIPMWDSSMSDQLPITLTDGQQASWRFALDNDDWLVSLITRPDENGKTFVQSKQDVDCFKFEVHTSNGQRLVLTPESEFMSRLSKAFSGSNVGKPAR